LKLQDIAVKDLPKYQSVAVSRLTLLTLARTHAIFSEFQEYLTGLVTKQQDNEGNAELQHVMSAWGTVSERYKEAFDSYTKLLTASRLQAGAIPFGVLVAQHNHFMAKAGSKTEAEATTGDLQVITQLFLKRREQALLAAQSRVTGDRLELSHRIWRIQNGGLNDIRSVIANAYTNRTNALALAKQLEHMLGADASMPRWAASRLYGMTATERAQSAKGLLSGPNNASTGIAYNAIRLARTELQYANHAVNTAIVEHAPWVVGRKINLSPAHPKSDICDRWASGGPYDKTEQILPLHPNCLCYYIDVLASDSEFTKNIKGWLAGENEYLDDYQDWLGTREPDQQLPWHLPLADALELWLSTGKGAQAAALVVPEPESLETPAIAEEVPVQLPIQNPPHPIAVKAKEVR